MSNAIIQTGIMTLKWVASVAARLLRNRKNDSLIRFTGAARVEPITMIDQRLLHLPYLNDALQSLSSLFCGYYLQAVALAVNVGNVNVLRLLDTLNPTRDVADAAATKLADASKGNINMLSLESYGYQLPRIGGTISQEASELDKRREKAEDQRRKEREAAAQAGKAYGPNGASRKDLENAIAAGDGDAALATGRDLMRQDIDDNNKSGYDPKLTGVKYGDKTLSSLSEAINLSVGKMLEVNINNGEAQATIPITVRLIATIVGSSLLTHILGDNSRDISLKERYHAWRAGQLQFWRDLVLCQDLIDEHKKALHKDDTGVYDAILARRQGNLAAGAMTSTPSIGTASNLIVMSAQTARELEADVGGRLRDPKVRDAIFKSTYIMIMLIIDVDHEQVTFYHRGIKLPTQLSVRELKTANKGTGPDVAEILRAYQLGMNPSI